MKTSNRKNRRGASILLLSFFFMMILFLLAAALYKLVPAEMHAAYRSTQDVKAHYVARTGIQETMAWLKFRITQFDIAQSETELPDYNSGTVGSPVYDNLNAFLAQAEATSPIDDDNWTYDLEILPLQDSIGQNHGFEPRFYSVRSTAMFNGEPIKSIDVLLKQRTFSSFALYTETMDPASKFVIDGKATIFGPVHTNDYFRFEAEPGIWADPNAEAYFSDVVSYSTPFDTSVSPDGAEWLGGTTNNPYANTEGTGYEKVFSKGRNGLRQKDDIELPSSTASIINDVWTSGTPLPTDSFAHIGVSPSAVGVNGDPLVTGGVYVGKNIDDMELRLDASGNQQTRIMDYWENTGEIPDPNATINVVDTSRPCDRTYYTTDYNDCLEFAPPGSAGGINGGNVDNCITYAQVEHNDGCYYIEVPDPGATATERTNFYTNVYEVTEAPVTYTDSDGTDHTAQIGQTLISQERRVRDPLTNVWSDYITDAVDVYDGQINGTFYVNGDIGSRWSGNNSGGGNGLWGIAKGTAITDSSGAIKEDGSGNREYLNKTIVTSLSRGVNLAGDILQFNEAKFDIEKANGLNFAGTFTDADGQKQNWTRVALDPNAENSSGEHEPELSPNNDHVLGIITRDAWMKGRKNSHRENGSDGINDIYAVILAGKAESDGSSSGGFGTWYRERNDWDDGLGQYRIFGGVIQGTTSANQGDNSAYTHNWTAGGVGYEASLFYDIEATRQRLFPTFPEFRIIRYLERSARR